MRRDRTRLKRRGLLFVGIDVIGGMMTEINVTSPDRDRRHRQVQRQRHAGTDLGCDRNQGRRPMSDWIIRLIEQSGYLGVAFLMFLETVFPPIPSEVIMSVAGVAAGQGKLNYWLVVVAGTAGAMLGNIFGTLPLARSASSGWSRLSAAGAAGSR